MNIQNPAALFQIMNLWSRFQKNHPKFPKFLSAVVQNGIREGSIIEIKVTTAEGESFDPPTGKPGWHSPWSAG